LSSEQLAVKARRPVRQGIPFGQNIDAARL
jgi:hypothetical protein